MDRAASIENIKKIRKLIANAENIKDMDFRIILEGLIKNGDENSEYAVIKYMRSIEIGLEVRLNIIRTAGYLHLPVFLDPLKKIVENENNVHLKKEAIISIAKYNDRKALNILNLALKDLRNSLLLQTLNNEISKIKQNNPILTLMPRFIKEKDNYKSFRVTVDILKRILNSKDSLNFLKFLSFNDNRVRDAAFEILCSTGPEKIKDNLFDFFSKRSSEIICTKNEECDEFLSIINEYYIYLERYPGDIDNRLNDLEFLFNLFVDVRIRSKLLKTIAISISDEALMILERIYNEFKDFREEVVVYLGKNPKSFEFLFNVYKSKSLKIEKIIIPLMMIDSGIKYFFDNFNEKEYDEQEAILKYFPLYGNNYYVSFCRNVLKSNMYNLKIMLLEKIKERGEFSVKDILFDPESEKEFLLMEKEYLSTILKLFPVSAVKKIFEIIVSEDFSVNKTKRFLKLIEPVLTKEIVFDFSDTPLLNFMSNKIVNINNNELNIIYLSIFSSIRVFSPKSYNDLNVALNIFTNQRGSKINVKEKYEIRKIKENLTNLSLITRKVEGMERTLRSLKSAESIPIEKFISIIKENSLPVVFYKDELSELIKNEFLKADFKDVPSWINFFISFPQVANLLKETILEQSSKFNELINKDLINLYRKIPDRTRIVLRFAEKDLIAILLDQFNEILPEIEIVFDEEVINGSDILFCDARSFKEIVKKNIFPTEYIFLFLEKITDFAEFKSYNPRFYVKPYSFNRILRDILKELFLINNIKKDK